MKFSAVVRSSLRFTTFLALAWMPQVALAQHGGGHGGGGGFHGGGGGGFHASGGGFHGGAAHVAGHPSYYGGGHAYSGYHGSGSYGGYHAHGGGYYGHGWHGGHYWGYPYYGWGWGWGFGWGWPYSGWGYGYPYGYWGYPTYYYSYPDNAPTSDPKTDPNNYPYQCPPGYSCIPDGKGNSPQGDLPPDGTTRPAPGAYLNGNPKPWRKPSSAPVPALSNSGGRELPPSGISQDMMRGRVLSVDRLPPDVTVATSASYRTMPPPKPVYEQMRPEVVRAMQHLHEMPPYAREREINTGRYSQFSAEEKQILRSVN